VSDSWRWISARLPTIALAALALGCGEGTAPPFAANLALVAGAAGTDTVDARLAQPLVAEVRGRGGTPLASVAVRFTALLTFSADGQVVAGVLVGQPGGSDVAEQVVDTTDAQGRAAVQVRLGPAARVVGVEVSVPGTGLADTARFTVQAGATATVALAPTDTAVFVGGLYVIKSRPLDRHGNVTADAVRLTAQPAGIVDVVGSAVTGRTAGRAALIADAGASEDTAWASVAPNDVVAVVFSGGRLATVRLDGSGFLQIPTAHTYNGAGIAWAPDASYLVAGFDNDARAIYRLTTAGASTLVLPSGTSVGQITAVDVSADGQWIYFSAGNCNFDEIIYRMPIAGGTPQRITASSADDCFETVQAHVSLAPDGLRAAVDHYYGNDTPVLQIVDLTTGLATSLDIVGSNPKWSPRGDRIAYVGNDRVWVASPDGSGVTLVSPPNTAFVPALSWSPDGEWLAAYQYPSATSPLRWVVLRVATGELIPLPATFDSLAGVSWKPLP
jgi:hypothetical protein